MRVTKENIAPDNSGTVSDGGKLHTGASLSSVGKDGIGVVRIAMGYRCGLLQRKVAGGRSRCAQGGGGDSMLSI